MWLSRKTESAYLGIVEYYLKRNNTKTYIPNSHPTETFSPRLTLAKNNVLLGFNSKLTEIPLLLAVFFTRKASFPFSSE